MMPLGKKWDKFWAAFGDLFSALPGVIEEGLEGIEVSNGCIKLTGRFESLHINGFEIRVPRDVLQGIRKRA